MIGVNWLIGLYYNVIIGWLACTITWLLPGVSTTSSCLTGLGYGMIGVNWLIGLYYNVIIGWLACTITWLLPGVSTTSSCLTGLGYGMIGVNWLIGLYYNVIIAWCFYYFFKSMTSELPWASCGNLWNTDHCIEGSNLTDLMKNTTMLGDVLKGMFA